MRESESEKYYRRKNTEQTIEDIDIIATWFFDIAKKILSNYKKNNNKENERK